MMQFITKKVALDNPATTLRVIFDANRESTVDIKVLHRTFEEWMMQVVLMS